MYARLVRCSVAPGSEANMQSLADDLGPQIAAHTGCQAVTVFGDNTDGEYGIYVLWDTQEHADAAAAVMGPQLSEHLQGIATGPPSRRLFEVIWSK